MIKTYNHVITVYVSLITYSYLIIFIHFLSLQYILSHYRFAVVPKKSENCLQMV